MSIATEIERIKNAKESIINTLKANDIQIDETATIDELDVTMKEVPILDTTDATATATDIVLNKTAYVNGKKIIGELDLSETSTNLPTIKDASYFFYQETRINQMNDLLPLLEETTNASYMFANCYSLSSLSFTNFTGSKIQNASYMFNYSSALTDLDLSNWDAGNVNNINYMFDYCSALKNLTFCKNLGKAYTQKSNTYQNYRINVSGSSNLTAASLRGILNNVYDLNLTYDVANGGKLYTQNIMMGATHKAKLTSAQIAIATEKGWTIS